MAGTGQELVNHFVSSRSSSLTLKFVSNGNAGGQGFKVRCAARCANDLCAHSAGREPSKLQNTFGQVDLGGNKHSPRDVSTT
jgi:hypothetical protein